MQTRLLSKDACWTAVEYTLTDTPLGRMLAAATPNGLCTVTLGDTDAELEAALVREYPNASLTRGGGPAAGWADALTRSLVGTEASLDLPLDIRATAFQRRVWQALQAIPRGETRSYSQVADALGQPAAARAVASACASNPVALVIPCHRVVRGDGTLSGYRWGVPRKQALLEREKAELGRGGCACPDNQSRGDKLGFGGNCFAGQQAQESLGRGDADLRQWLAHGGERRLETGGVGDVVEADDRKLGRDGNAAVTGGV